MNHTQTEQDDANIFTTNTKPKPPKSLILIGCIATLFFAFILVNSFLNINFNQEKNQLDNVRQNIVFNNVKIYQNDTKKGMHSISGRVINQSSSTIKNLVLKIDFSDCKNALDCLTIGEHHITISHKKIPPEHARDFSIDFATNTSMQAQETLKTSWTIETFNIIR